MAASDYVSELPKSSCAEGGVHRWEADIEPSVTVCQLGFLMKVLPEEYERMRAWMARLARELIPATTITPETDPVKVLDQMASRAPAQARKGLAIAIGDFIEMTNDWPPPRVSALDQALIQEALPSLSEMRLRFSKAIDRIVRRERINNEQEYYAVRNAVEHAGDGQTRLWALLTDYEEKGLNADVSKV